MASAWGDSWGGFWGNSWGSVDGGEETDERTGGPSDELRRLAALQDDEEVIMLVARAFLTMVEE